MFSSKDNRYTTSLSCQHCRMAKFCLPSLCALNDKVFALEGLVEHKRALQPHELLIRQSTPQKYLYAIHSGSLKGFYIDNAGREHVSNFYYHGDVVGLEFMFYGKFLTDIVALEATVLCYISLTKFKQLHQRSPELREQLINIYSQHLWNSYSMHGSYNSRQLVIHFLLNLSSHAASLGESESELILSMGRHDIGNFLGLSSETVSRALTQLKKDGLIKVNRNSIKLNQIAQLKKLAT